MKIEIFIDKIDSFLPNIARQFNVKFEGSTFQLPKDQGKGFFTQMQFNSNILITYYELVLNETTTVVRKACENDNILPIIFWVSNSGITQELNSEKKTIGRDTPNGIFFPSNHIETKYSFPAGVPIKNITIFINKKWLKENIISQNDFINNYILEKTNYFLFEEITFKMSETIRQIEDILKHKMHNTLSKLNLYLNTLTLANHFFEKLLERPLNKQVLNINPLDIEQIFKIKTILINNFINIPTTPYLAKTSGMNERKMQNIFKQVFGKSIYQFALSIKMEEAKKLLKSKKLSISEVGYQVGYSNLSHFAEKFKMYFGSTPKKYLSSI
jgi:AraC-like DNA-binding protein